MNIVTNWLARYLDSPSRDYSAVSTSPPRVLANILQPADVLLVEGDRRISVAIKYLTQSTWSHAAVYVGDVFEQGGDDPDVLIEADLEAGVVMVPLSKYENLHTRICRPQNLTDEDLQGLIDFIVARIGYQYDLKNIIDLVRYLLPTPPVPVRWRRRMIALGSGDPTRAICSTLIAEAFQSIGYPILPTIEIDQSKKTGHAEREIMHIRHHSLYTPRDFDISPFFEVVKPNLVKGFNYKNINWAKKLQ
ncbi:MAG: lipo-like protein [Gammaproteobacteria bacterium]|nr:lipo-like protein [Gammaproteobacteria bacterium]